MKNNRPNPDELLQAVQKMDRKTGRGSLRVFLGMCPGVGKTYAMLKAAREEQKRGTHVVVGVVETHDRKETEELLVGLNIAPRKKIEYKGSEISEMDLDQVLNGRPTLVLVDELAHTNAPGSRHSKRHQDVEELLKAGINVFTTVNIQHIESRNDQVAQITGVLVRETVPDSFFEYADQIEVIDLSPNELLRRLKEGKVYLGERAERAEQGFFKEEVLTALRELALRFTAEKVDRELQDHMTMKGIEGPWNTNERLLVAVSYSPYSGRLIRATRRMAYNLEAPWIALYVDSGENLNIEDKETLQKNLTLARELGAEVITLADADINHAIQKICHEKNVTQIVMGRPDRRFFQDFLARGSLLERLVRTTSKIDVHVIRAERAPLYRGFHIKWPQFTTGFMSYWYVTWFLIAVSFVCYASIPYVGYRALGSVFLLAILTVSTLSTRGPILFAAFTSAIVWNYFFIPPRFTFAINSWEDTMMVLSFFVAALVGGLLTARIRKQGQILEQREERTLVLYDLSRSLSTAKDPRAVTLILNEIMQRQFDSKSVVLLNQDQPTLIRPDDLNEKDFAVASWAFEQGKRAGWSTQTLSASDCLSLPLVGKSGVVGVLVILPNNKENALSFDQESFLDNIVNQCAIAIERLNFVEASQQKVILEASEKLHQTLINSVSHELRTPITALIGTSSALKDEKTFSDKKAREALTDDLVASAHRLDRVVENLLDMSRLESGTLKLKKEWFEVKDLFDAAISSFGRDGDGIEIRGDSTTLVNGDFKLLQHSLYNLIANGLKYSGAKNLIVETHKDVSGIEIFVIDSGPGVPKASEAAIFDKFYRLPGTAAGGLGLGLSIVKNIIELHDGSVSASSRKDGKPGAQFRIYLSVQPVPSELKEVLE